MSDEGSLALRTTRSLVRGGGSEEADDERGLELEVGFGLGRLHSTLSTLSFGDCASTIRFESLENEETTTSSWSGSLLHGILVGQWFLLILT